MTEQEAQLGDFEGVYGACAGKLFTYTLFKCSNAEEAQDIVAEAFTRLWQKMQQGERLENPKAFLYTIVNGLVIDNYRKNAVRRNVPIEDVPEKFFEIPATIESEILERGRLQDIHRQLEKLRSQDKELIVLYYLHDMSVKEIAQIQDKQENAVRVALHRALTALKEKISYA
jgi:RNA polymerase sigma-70 factor (ECF subfamily)